MKRAATMMIWAALFWGFGFVASVWTLTSFGPVTSTAIRFSLAATVGALAARLRFKKHFWSGWKEGFVPGVLLTLTVGLQTWGLLTTTATKSAFILGLYVFMVPVWGIIFEGEVVSQKHWFYVAIATLGSYLILGNPFDGEWTTGDWLTLVSMLIASAQIFWLSYRQKRLVHRINAEIFNSWQMIWAALPALASLIFVQEKIPENIAPLAILGLLVLSFGSTLLAFHLQVAAQAQLPSTMASMLCLLESPFAVLFATIFLQESLELWQAIGCVLVMGSAMASLGLGAKHSGFSHT